MRGCTKRYQWAGVLLLGLAFIAACSTQRQNPRSDMVADADDPFTDPLFTQIPGWNDSVLRESEALAQDTEETEKPPSFLELSEGIIFSIFLVGASLARLALPFGGL
jgi:hypothetical protein